MNEKKLSNWKSFTGNVKKMLEAGASEEEISEQLSGKEVSFSGVIVDIKLEEEYCPGIALNMTPGSLSLSKGRVLRSDYLFLNINNDSQSWSKCKLGSCISFNAMITKNNIPFPAVQISEDDEDPEVLLMLGLEDCKLLSIEQ